MKKLFNYLRRDFVDLTLWLFFVAVLIKGFVNHWWADNMYALAGIVFAVIYILAVMFRFGRVMDFINEYVSDETARRGMGLNPWILKDKRKRIPLTELIFRAFFIIALLALLTVFVLFNQ